MGAALKVINLGLPKSGTTTLGEACKLAGLRVADWRIRKKGPHHQRFVGDLMYEGYFKRGDPLAMMPDYDVFSEISIVRNDLNLWPQTDMGIITAIRARHAGARFLLSYRDPGKLSDSMGRWSNLGRHRLPVSAVPGMPVGYGGTDSERIRWIEGHYAFCRQMFLGADDFLEYDVEDKQAPEKIGAFLELALPWWGKANANAKTAQPSKQSATN